MTSTLVVRKCALTEVVDAPNFPELAAEYAAESAMAGMPAPDTKIDTYRQLEAAGALQAFGAFLDAVPIGFIGVLHHVIPHYGVGVAISESFFVAAAHRHTGAANKLLAMAEEHALALGSPGLLISAPAGGSLVSWMRMRMDYRLASLAFFKRFE